MTAAPIFLSAILVAAGILSVRIGWGRRQGGRFVALGWAAVIAGLALLAARDGAWGLAVGAVVATLAASLLLGQAALSSAPAPARNARTAAPSVLLRSGGGVGVLRRLAVFILVIPVGAIASALAALAAQAAARQAGWPESDSTAFGLFAFPVVWAILVTLLMLRPGPKSMLAPLAVTLAASGGLFWIFI